jgi:RsiW-degrading membrane proteinase PrsW (M82 family)
MSDIMNWILIFSISAAFIGLYYAVDLTILKQKPDLVSLLIGLGPVAFTSYVAETYLYTLSFSLVLSLMFIAPIIEESAKFAATAYGKKIRNGLGVGLGFALSENALYFHTFVSMSSLSIIIISYIILRGFGDPLLHQFTAGIDTKTWEKSNPGWIGIAMATHIGYNFAAIVMASLTPMYIYPIMAGEIIALLVGMKFLTRIKEEKKEETQEVKKEEKTEAVKKETELDYSSLDAFRKSVREFIDKEGFNALVRKLKMETGYERTKFIRTAKYESENGNGRYIEIGPAGAAMIAGIIAGLGYLVYFFIL